MIEMTQGDILQADAQALVNTVNCVGVMGRGIALQFKRAYPENFKFYTAACTRNEVRPGKMLTFATGAMVNPRFIVNFPTKRHWRGDSRIEDIESGLVDLVHEISRLGIQSIAIPPLGAGLGGLDWNAVRPMIELAMQALPDVAVQIFEPEGAPQADRMARAHKVPKMTKGRAALVALMLRYLKGLLDPAISLLEVHKLMYFLEQAGEPLRLKFEKATYGPYAENLKHVLNEIEGHFVSGYADGGDQPDKQLSLVPGAEQLAETVLADELGLRNRLHRVFELVDGFESPHGMELLATVHWLAREQALDPKSLCAQVHAWNTHKRVFTERQIRIAQSRLTALRWIPTAQAI
jgi:O-acetyl-ADP-ribose deacetylase (regulator of RNase III)